MMHALKIRMLALLVFGAVPLGAACAQEAPINYVLVSWPNLSTLDANVETVAYPPAPAPTAAELVAASAACDEVLLVANQLNVRPANIYDRVQSTQEAVPLSPARKLRLALINASDPFNLATAGADAAISAWTADSDSAYGTGGMAFAKRFGTDMTDELSGEFFQTFLFPSIFRQDPHYHRDLDQPTGKRIRYALLQVFVTRSDAGHRMFNFGEVLGNVASASLANVYHPDRAQGVGPTAARIGVSIASDSAWNLFSEFWPDVAKHMNIRMVFLRRLAERAAKPND